VTSRQFICSLLKKLCWAKGMSDSVMMTRQKTNNRSRRRFGNCNGYLPGRMFEESPLVFSVRICLKNRSKIWSALRVRLITRSTKVRRVYPSLSLLGSLFPLFAETVYRRPININLTYSFTHFRGLKKWVLQVSVSRRLLLFSNGCRSGSNWLE
jgi:hypothetical protein